MCVYIYRERERYIAAVVHDNVDNTNNDNNNSKKNNNNDNNNTNLFVLYSI